MAPLLALLSAGIRLIQRFVVFTLGPWDGCQGRMIRTEWIKEGRTGSP